MWFAFVALIILVSHSTCMPYLRFYLTEVSCKGSLARIACLLSDLKYETIPSLVLKLWQVPIQRETFILLKRFYVVKADCFDLLFECHIVYLNTEILVPKNAAE